MVFFAYRVALDGEHIEDIKMSHFYVDISFERSLNWKQLTIDWRQAVASNRMVDYHPFLSNNL